MSFFVSGPEGHDYDLRQLTEDQKRYTRSLLINSTDKSISFYVNVIQPALIDGSGATTRPGIWNTFSIVRGGIEDPVEIKAIKCSMDSNDIPLDQRAPGTAILYMNGRIEGPTGPCEGSSTGSDHLFEDYL